MVCLLSLYFGKHLVEQGFDLRNICNQCWSILVPVAQVKDFEIAAVTYLGGALVQTNATVPLLKKKKSKPNTTNPKLFTETSCFVSVAFATIC